MSEVNAALAAFNAHVDQLEQEHGIELSDEERQRVFGLSVSGGFSPEATMQAFGDLVDDGEEFDDSDDFEEDDDEDGVPDQLVADVDRQLERLARDMGRSMSEHELEAVTKTANQQLKAGDRIDLKGALHDYQKQFETPQTRQEFFRRRMQEQQPPTEIRDEYDMTTHEGRSAYADARLNGGMAAEDFEDVPGEAA